MLNFQDYKRMQQNGVTTTGSAHTAEAMSVIESSWYDDPASCIGYLYDMEHDDEPNKNKGLHPEKSKTKTKVDLKYILTTYRSLSKDEVDSRIMFKPSYQCNVSYYEEKFEKPTHGVFPSGMYLDLQDEKGSWNRWLVINTASGNNHDFPTWSILPCGHKFQWIFDGKKQECWGVERSQSSYTSGLWRDRVFESPDNITKCIMPYNEITKNFFYNTRIILFAELMQPLAWRVSKVEPFAHRGNIMFTLKEDVFDQNHDFIERDDDGNIIGMWADMYQDYNFESIDTSDHEVLPLVAIGDYAEITYSGAEPLLKINGSYKTITINYYNSNELLKNQNPGDWEFTINGDDVSDVIDVMDTEEPNIIKVKFIGTEEYIDKILTIKNTRDEVVAELRLQIVAL